MATILHFPSGDVRPTAEHASIKAEPPTVRTGRKRADAAAGNISPIRPRVRIPKFAREEDQSIGETARLVKRFTERAYELAQSEPNSERHLLAVRMTGLAGRLPCNKLRLFTTPDDLVEGLWVAWKRLRVLNLEYLLCEARRLESLGVSNDERRELFSRQQDEADTKRWAYYERLIRIPATNLADFARYKVSREFPGGMGNLEWMRKHKPEFALVLDDERQRLEVEKAERKAAKQARCREARP